MDLLVATTQMQGFVWALLAVPVCIWATLTDIREMKIKNVAVLALLAIFVVTGPFLMDLGDYAWRFAHFAVVLAIGFVLSATVGVGAGDAKFAAAMAPFVALADVSLVMTFYVLWSVVLLIGMFSARATPALRTAAPDWIWFAPEYRRYVPFGVGLAPTLACYLIIAAIGPGLGFVNAENEVEIRSIELTDGESLLPDAPAGGALLPPTE
jgi:prepilin peptidase CpaA